MLILLKETKDNISKYKRQFRIVDYINLFYWFHFRFFFLDSSELQKNATRIQKMKDNASKDYNK